MDRNYQYDFSSKMPSMYDVESRERKARTMVAVLSDFFGDQRLLEQLTVLDIGSSTGIIDNYLSGYFKSVTGIDIDAQAVSHANNLYRKRNLKFLEEDAMNLRFDNDSFDVVICSQVYEHVPDSHKLIKEIYRVLKPSGVCFFSAGNSFNLIEPHYKLPLLSIVPKPLAHIYMRLAGKGDHYYEEHLSYWKLRRLTMAFVCHDYTRKTVNDPGKYGMEYMLRPGSITAALAKLIARRLYWAFPNYIWLLQKPDATT